MKKVRMIVISLTLGSLVGCAPIPRITVKGEGYNSCIRLDREPVADQDNPRCGSSISATIKTGTFHKQVDHELDSDMVLVTVGARFAEKLPVSSCLWVGSSQFGGTEVIAPQYEGLFQWEEVGDPNEQIGDGPRSACRLDVMYPRQATELSGDDVIRACAARFFGNIQSGLQTDTSIFSNRFKSTCDVPDLEENEIIGSSQLVAGLLPNDGYGLCGSTVPTQFEAINLGNSAGACSQVGVRTDGTASFAKQITPRTDQQLHIRNRIGVVDQERSLWPRIHTVVDKRTIARPLTFQDDGAHWQADVLKTDANGTRWFENFTEFVRIDAIRVFSVQSRAVDVREYLALDGAELRVVDSDSGDDTPLTCSPVADEFEMVACDIDATPTYTIDTLRESTGPLTTPLQWQIVADGLEDNGREWYVEFELDSVFRTMGAVIAADRESVDFGKVSQTDVRSEPLLIDSVGSGHFVVDTVEIDPAFGDASSFRVRRLDDPVDVPHPVIATHTEDGGIKLSQGGWDMPFDIGAIEEQGEFVMVPRPRLDGTDLEVLGVPMVFTGNVPVIQGTNIDTAGLTANGDQSYPLRYQAFVEWPLPRTLAPTENRALTLEVRPQRAGELKAMLRVSGYPLHTPAERQTIEVPLSAYGTFGPQVDVLPTSLGFPYGARRVDTRNAIVVSWGDADIVIDSVELLDGAAGDAINFSIDYAPPKNTSVQPGASHNVTVSYAPGCFYEMPLGGEHRAILRVATSVGDYDIPLIGDPARWVDGEASGCGFGQ
ncbi:MAG: hypothetical protein AAGJ86_05050 [Pseudomonadota bacterium]